jgi:hypothetical protein
LSVARAQSRTNAWSDRVVLDFFVSFFIKGKREGNKTRKKVHKKKAQQRCKQIEVTFALKERVLS